MRGDYLENYAVDEIVTIIKNYHNNLCYTQAILEESFQSVGVSQYGIEATMPHGSGISDPVASQVMKSIKTTQHVADNLTDLKYLQDRTYRIDNEKDAIVLFSLMSGKTYKEIADMLKCTPQNIHQRVERIAYIIKGV